MRILESIGQTCLPQWSADESRDQQRQFAWRLLAFLVAPAVGFAFLADASELPRQSQVMQARGVVRPADQAKISVDLVAPLAKIGFREGQQFRKGDVLLEFDCRRQQAELASAMAQQREMAVTLESALFLEKRGAGSRQDSEISRARSERATADVEAIRARLAQCVIVAPYSGHVVDLGIQAHELPAAGKPLLAIVSTGDPEIELIVPSSWLNWLRVGAELKFFIDETRLTHAGTVVRLGAAIDTVSQTIKVYGRFTTPSPEILPGMSGTASF